MSLAGVSPLINSWIERGLEWTWFWRPVQQAFTIPANGQVQIPSEGYTFRAPEGTLLTLNGVFDHPKCGIRGVSHPGLDTENIFTVECMTLVGFSNTPMYVTALLPPRTPPGVFAISQQKEWPWTQSMEMYLINTDSIPHSCLTYSYTVALLKGGKVVEGEGS